MVPEAVLRRRVVQKTCVSGRFVRAMTCVQASATEDIRSSEKLMRTDWTVLGSAVGPPFFFEEAHPAPMPIRTAAAKATTHIAPGLWAWDPVVPRLVIATPRRAAGRVGLVNCILVDLSVL